MSEKDLDTLPVKQDGILAADAAEAGKANGHNASNTTSLPSSSQSLTHIARRFGRALLPSFLNPRIANYEVKSAAQYSSTLYLDGLRGYAAIAVLNSHVVTAFTIAPQIDWGWHDGETLSPLAIPIFRLAFSGPGMVTLFFLISGFSCSLKPLEAMAVQDSTSQAKALKSLSSSLMRRWFRLYLPVLSCTFLLTLIVYCGGFSLMPYYLGDENLLHPPEKFIFKYPTLREQFTIWFNDMYDLLNIWHVWPNGTENSGYYAPYSNPHMWFITVEFKASLILYTTLLATAIAKPGARFAVLAGFASYMFVACKDEILPYFFGACLAQIKLSIDGLEKNNSSQLGNAATKQRSRLSPLVHEADKGPFRIFWIGCTVLSLWLMSTPAWSFHGPAYYIFTVITPANFVRQQTFLQLLGVAGLLLCLMTSSPESWIRKQLASPLALYLGKISFAVYIVHGPVLLAIGLVVPVAVMRTLGAGPVGFVLALILAEAVTIVLSICVADVFQREVEGRCVRLTRRIEALATGKSS